MAIIVRENVKRTRSLLVILAVFTAATAVLLVFGNPLAWLGRLAVPPDLTGSSGSRPVVPERFFDDPVWRSLQRYGRLPIAVGSTGRASAFVAPADVATPAARDARRVAHLGELIGALRRYRADAGSYPVGRSLVVGSAAARCLGPAGWLEETSCPSAGEQYLEVAPQDPGSGAYTYTSDGQSYTITLTLETAPAGSREVTYGRSGD